MHTYKAGHGECESLHDGLQGEPWSRPQVGLERVCMHPRDDDRANVWDVAWAGLPAVGCGHQACTPRREDNGVSMACICSTIGVFLLADSRWVDLTVKRVRGIGVGSIEMFGFDLTN